MEEEFVEIKERIVRTDEGPTSTKSIIAKSPNLSEDFVHMLWNDYLIDVREIEEAEHENAPDYDDSRRGH